MHDMSNTRKEIAARLGFAAGNGAKESFASPDDISNMAQLLSRVESAVMNKRMDEARKLLKQIAPIVDRNRGDNELDSQGMVRAFNDYKQKLGMSRPGAKAEFGNADRLDSLMAAVYRALKNNDKAAAKRLMADAAKEIDENTPSYILAEYKDLKKGMSRPGAKTRMTREQTEEQKAGLKIMSAADPAVGAKIATLIKEGKPQDQAVAIALDMKRRGEL